MAVVLGAAAGPAAAATTLVDCTKNDKLQQEIDKADDGDTIQIKGICMENIVIRNKALTLVGYNSPGLHGITGVATSTDGVRIESSRGAVLQGLTISNPHFSGVRIRFNSEVEMIDCEVSDSFAGGATGIWVQEGSRFFGLRLTLNDNLRGLGALQYSRAFCQECDLNDNVNWAASALDHSVLSLQDSEVNGDRGLQVNAHSYADIDCAAVGSGHACTLDTNLAGIASQYSTLAFYDAGHDEGDFNGNFHAAEHSQVQLFGTRQQVNPGTNNIGGGSSLRVEPFSANSQVVGHTEVSGFSHALFHDASTVLDGSLSCSAGGDAWVDGAIDLVTPGYTITDCDQAPTACVTSNDVEYIISGGPEPDAGIYVDDILEVFRDEELSPFVQVGQGGGCCQAAAPIRFRGNTGEEIRVVARDGNDCYSLRALYLQKADGSCLTQLSGDIFGPDCGNEPPEQTFFDQTFVLP